MFLFGFVCSKKKHMRKRSVFWQKPWTNPFAKCRFFRLCENCTFGVQKTLFSIQNIKKCFFLAFFAKKKNIFENGRFFDKNHGLTPLENVDFFRLCENFTFEVPKALLSIQNIKECFFLAFFAQKEHIRKRSIFWQKPWTKPFTKCRYF